MPIYEFLCDKCGCSADRLTGHFTQTIECTCGGTMSKQFSVPNFILDGTDPDFPGAYGKWGRDRMKNAERHKKKSYYEP